MNENQNYLCFKKTCDTVPLRQGLIWVRGAGMPKVRIDMAKADMDTNNAAIEKDMAKARADITMAQMDPL
jgi:hypothetical protein